MDTSATIDELPEDKRLSQAMKHFYGKKAKTREISNSLSKNIDEAELTPRLTEKGNTSLYSAGASALGVISEKA